MKKPASFLLICFLSIFLFVEDGNCTVREISFSPESDSTQIVHTIRSFLHWYKVNYSKSIGFRLVGSDKNGNYFVNKKNCKKYLKHLKSSGRISDVYISHWNRYFSEMEQKFKANPQNEGPPEGFDYDLVTGTQEPDLLYNAGDQLKYHIQQIEKNHAVIITSDIWDHRFALTKSGGKWIIDSIDVMGYTE
jgi:hypothetical protein